MCPLREERHWTIVCGSSLVEYRCQQRYTPTTCYEMDLYYYITCIRYVHTCILVLHAGENGCGNSYLNIHFFELFCPRELRGPEFND